MNKVEKSKFDSNGRVNIFITANDAALILITLYAAIKSRFLSNMVLLNEAILKQAAEIKMFASSKKAAKIKMAELIIKFAGRARLQAKSLDKIALAMSLDKKISFISRASADDALTRAKELLKIMSDNSTLLTVLIPDDFTDMQKKIDNYRDLVFMPKSEIKKRKTEGTQRIAEIQKDIETDKEDIGTLVRSYLPDLYATYEEAAKIGKPSGTRHTSMVLHVVDSESGADLRYVRCNVTTGIVSYNRKTTVKGYVRLYSLVNALWNVTAEFPGYETFIQEKVGTDKFKIVTLEIRLKKKPMSEIKTGSFVITALNEKTGQPMSGLKLKLNQSVKEYVSNSQGEFSESAMICGDCEGTITGEGVETENVIFTVNEGMTTELTFMMEDAG
ncbi:MAG: carboxypeptidase-like regulatory domain-containing protein [Bacteroidota bacterium]